MASSMATRPAPDDVKPVCPACKKELDYVWEKATEVRSSVLFAGVGSRVLLCPHCRIWLGQAV